MDVPEAGGNPLGSHPRPGNPYESVVRMQESRIAMQSELHS